MSFDQERFDRAANAVRWNYTRGQIWPGPAPRPEVEPLDETTLRALRRSLAAALGPPDPLEDPTEAALRRSRLSEPRPVPETPPPKPSPTEFKGALRTYTHMCTTIGGAGNSTALCTELITLPSIVRRVLITTEATAQNQADIVISTCLSVNPSEAEIRNGQIIYPDPSSGLGGAGIHNVAAGSTFAFPIDKVITQVPFRLVTYIENIDAGPHRVHTEITTQDLDPENVRIISVPVILQPQVFSRSLMTAPLPRGNPQAPQLRPVTPRALRIKVMQDRLTIYSRDVAWPAVAPEIRNRYYQAQMSGKPDPCIEPIW